jgi:hypothetical protein
VKISTSTLDRPGRLMGASKESNFDITTFVSEWIIINTCAVMDRDITFQLELE